MTAKERIMRVRAAQPRGRADVPTVKPSYANGTRFPIQVRLPLPVSRFARLGRTIMIAGPDQQVPTIIVEWMQEDTRYCHLLADDQPVSDGKQADTAGQRAEVTDPNPDDLTVIKGIGPSGVAKLAEKGIVSYAQVSEASAADIAGVLGRPTSTEKAQLIISQARELATKE